MLNAIHCHLIRDLRAAPFEASLLGDGDQGHGVPVHCDCLVTVRVPEDDVGDPEFANLTKIVRRAFPLNLSNHMYIPLHLIRY